MTKITAVIFDFDGTLIDSEYFHYEIWRMVLSGFNVKIDFDLYLRKYAGIPVPINAQRMIDLYQLDVSPDEFIKQREEIEAGRISTFEFKLMPFVRETIHFLFERNISLGIATGSPKRDVKVILERTGLNNYFQSVITLNDVRNGKPDPECYQLCSLQLGSDKSKQLVLEDSRNGVESAISAGLKCFAIQSNADLHEKLNLADRIFSNLNEAKTYLVDEGFL